MPDSTAPAGRRRARPGSEPEVAGRVACVHLNWGRLVRRRECQLPRAPTAAGCTRVRQPRTGTVAQSRSTMSANSIELVDRATHLGEQVQLVLKLLLELHPRVTVAVRTPSLAFQPWHYRPETGLPGEEVDLTGYSIAAIDGDIGHVDQASNELLGESYLVVDTGPWISSAARCCYRPVRSSASTQPTRRSTSTGPRTRSRTRQSTTNSRTTPSIGIPGWG